MYRDQLITRTRELSGLDSWLDLDSFQGQVAIRLLGADGELRPGDE